MVIRSSSPTYDFLIDHTVKHKPFKSCTGIRLESYCSTFGVDDDAKT